MIRPLALLIGTALLAGCAGSSSLTTADVRARLPALEARAEAAPSDVAALRELGRAYARVGAFDRARETLLQAERLAPRDAGTAYTLGLVDEAQDRPAQALARYRAAGGAAPYGPLVAGRRAWLEGQAARTEVDSLLDAERYPAVGAGVVAVFPLRFQGDAALRPLARGVTALLTDDLALLDLRVVDGRRVRAALDALALGPDDVGADRARRLGRLLGGDYVVVGSLAAQGDSLRLEAALWEWTEAPAPAFADASGALDALLRVEADLVLEFADRARIVLSESARANLRARRTPDAAAFLQYSRGLLEEDAGRYAEAAALYAEAARLDPAFRLAADRAAASQALEAAGGSVLTALAVADRLGPSVAATRLVGRRLTRVNQGLGVHTPALDGERVPTAEVPLAPPTQPLPEPPRPPGRNQTPR